jgi:NAD(P)H dehydrogenase (quinone)
VFGDPLAALWRNCIFGPCGVRTVYREAVGVVVTSTLEQRQEWLRRAQEVVGQYFAKA